MTEVKTPLGDGALELIKSMLEELKKGFTVTSRGDDIFEIIDIQAENLHYLMTEAYQAKAAIQRVRELHKSEESEGHNESCNQMDCQGCFYVETCVECVELYPCPTIKALDGDQS